MRTKIREIAHDAAPGLIANRARAYETQRRKRDGLDRLAERLPDMVQDGPFQGMRLHQARIAEIDAPMAKLLGTYELELYDVIERMLDEGRSFLDIGSADGYYAVGMAYRGAHVVAYDIARSARDLCLQTARLNGVQVHQRARYKPQDAGPSFVLCDVEGAEREIFTSSLPYRHAVVLIEVHEGSVPGTSAYLQGVFSHTHSCAVIGQQPRETPEAIVGWAQDERRAAVDEYRHPALHWLLFEPR